MAAGALTAAGQGVHLAGDDAGDDSGAESTGQARALTVAAGLAGTEAAGLAGAEPDDGASAAEQDRSEAQQPGRVGTGGRAPAVDQLPTPDVLPVQQETQEEDLDALQEGIEVAEERAAQARREAQQALADAMGSGASQLPVESGGFVAPTTGTFTSGFGTRWGSFHSGIDLANAVGTPIYAVTDGVVIESGPASGFGMWVQIRDDNGTVSMYGHIHESLVSVGEQVAAGEQIATMGNRGFSTGPHLHFEVWRDGSDKVDPQSWLSEHGIET